MFESRGKMMAENRYDAEGMNVSAPLKDARIIAEHAAAVCAAMERAANLVRE
jgi:hypothetical protein